MVAVSAETQPLYLYFSLFCCALDALLSQNVGIWYPGEKKHDNKLSIWCVYEQILLSTHQFYCKIALSMMTFLVLSVKISIQLTKVFFVSVVQARNKKWARKLLQYSRLHRNSNCFLFFLMRTNSFFSKPETCPLVFISCGLSVGEVQL